MKSPTEQPINDKRKKVAIISRSGKQCRQKRVHAEIGTPGHRGLALITCSLTRPTNQGGTEMHARRNGGAQCGRTGWWRWVWWWSAISAPAEFAAQRLGPGHCKIAYTHRESALGHHLCPVPPPPTPSPTEFEPPALAAATGLPPEVARHPQLDGPRATGEAADSSPTDDRPLFVPDEGQAEMCGGPTDGL